VSVTDGSDEHDISEAAWLAIATRAEMIRAGLTPETVYPGFDRPWMVRCQRCSALFVLTLHELRRGRGCPRCKGLGAWDRSSANDDTAAESGADSDD
jgi:hypothetical protein